MKPKTMLLMVVAIGCGLAASVMTSRLIAERGAGQPAEEKVKVIVTKVKIPKYEQIKDPQKYFVEKELPISAVPKKVLKNFDQVKDQRVGRNLGEDMFLTEEDLVSTNLDGLAAALRPGSRAVAIKVTAESQVSGFVLPGSHVDVTCVLRGGNGTEPEVKTFLQDMLVLAVDTVNGKPDDRQAIIGSTVTLAVRPEEAQRLFLAQSLGDLRLMLRPVGETSKVGLHSTKLRDLNKPLPEQGNTEQGNGENNGTDQVAGVPVPPLPPMTEIAPPPPMLPATPVAEAKKPEPDPVEKHVMTILTGDNVQRVVFLKDKEGWNADGITRMDTDERGSSKKPQPDRKPAPDSKVP
jgi:pilus assembly protein CpaB